MRMLFGKYRGYEIEDIPIEYLEWLAANVELRGNLRIKVVEILLNRKLEEYPFNIEPSDLRAIYHRLAMKWHPDRGGSQEAMQAINEFYEQLRKE